MIDDDYRAKTLDALRGVAHDVGLAVRDEGCIDDAVVAAETEYEKKREGRPMTRRGALIGGAAFLAGMLMWNPRLAFAGNYAESDLGFTANWGGQANYSYNYPIRFDQIGDAASRGGGMYYNLHSEAVTPWFEWAMEDGQYLGAALHMDVKCDFATELYFHLQCSVAVACISYADYGSSGYWGWYYTEGGDCILELYLKKDGGAWSYAKSQGSAGREDLGYAVDMNCDIQNTHGAAHHNIFRGPYGSFYSSKHQWTNFIEFGDEDEHTFSVWVRRVGTKRRARTEKWELELGGGFYDWSVNWYGNSSSIGKSAFIGKNYCASYGSTYYNRADGQPVYASTGYMPLTQPDFFVKTTKALTGRIMEICPYSQQGKRLDVAGARCNQGDGLCCWSDTHTTNQNWAISGNADLDRFGTASLHPVVGGDDYWLDMQGTGTSPDPDYPADPSSNTVRTAWVYPGNGTMCQSFWLHPNGLNGEYIVFADASGHCLDVAGGCKADDETSDGGVVNNVQFHVDPANLSSEWGNEGHRWIFKDAMFGLRSGSNLEVSGLDAEGCPKIDQKVTVGDISKVTWPGKHPNSSQSGLGYEYAWGCYDAEDDLSWIGDEVVVWGWVTSTEWGKFDQEMYGNSLIGFPDSSKHSYICGLHLRVAGSSLPGDIVYAMRRHDNGNWSDERKGSETTFVGYENRADMWFTGFKAHLTGELAEKYELHYHVYGDNAGWGDWQKDGAEAKAGTGPDWIQAVCIRVQPKCISGQGFGYAGTSITPTEDMAGKNLAFFARAYCTGLYFPYRGLVAERIGSGPVEYDRVIVKLFVDGEEFQLASGKYIEFKKGDPVVMQTAWTNEAKQYENRDKTCAGFHAWFTDATCKTHWNDGTVPPETVKSINLYAYNDVEVTYATTSHALSLAEGRALCSDADLTQAVDIKKNVPGKHTGRVHDQYTSKLPDIRTLFYSDAGATRKLSCSNKLYGSDYVPGGTKPAAIAAPKTFELKHNVSYYVDWDDDAYDGFIGE